MNETKQTPVFSFRLPVSIRRDLDTLATDKDMSVAQLIIEILKGYLYGDNKKDA